MIEQFSFRRIELVSKVKPFDCGDPDLNEFFQKEMKIDFFGSGASIPDKEPLPHDKLTSINVKFIRLSILIDILDPAFPRTRSNRLIQ
jgi:hypothetical protein